MQVIFLTYVNRSGSTFLVNQLSKLDEFLVLPEGEILVKKLLLHPTKRMDRNTFNIILKDQKIKCWRWKASFSNDLMPNVTNAEFFFYLLDVYRKYNKPQSEILVFKAWELIFTLGKIPSDLISKYNVRYFGLYRDVRAVACSQKLTIYKNKPLENNIVSATIKWKSFMKICQANDHMISMLRYEEMISRYNDFIRVFCEEFDIIWDPSLAYHSGQIMNSLPEDQISLHPYIDHDPQPEFCEKWKIYLSMEEIKIIQELGSKELLKLGYPIIPVNTSFIKLIYNWIKYFTGYWLITILHPAH